MRMYAREMCESVCVWVRAKCSWDVSDLDNNPWIRRMLIEAMSRETTSRALWYRNNPIGAARCVFKLDALFVFMRIYVRSTNSVTGGLCFLSLVMHAEVQ